MGLRGPQPFLEGPQALELGPQPAFCDSEPFWTGGGGAQADGGQARESGRQGLGGAGALSGSERVKEAWCKGRKEEGLAASEGLPCCMDDSGGRRFPG
jgi:hypothetical protein